MLRNHPKIRLGLYLASLAGLVAQPFIAILAPEFAVATLTAAGVLAAAAGVTAATNVPKPEA